MLIACVLSLSLCIPAFAEVITEYGDYEASTIIEYYQATAVDDALAFTEDEILEYEEYYASYGLDDIVTGYEQLRSLLDEMQGAELMDSWMETTGDTDTPVKVVYQLENENGTFLCTLYMTEDLSVTSLTYEKGENTTLGQLMVNAAKNTVVGIGVVFIVLIVICVLISLFKYLPGSGAKQAKKQQEAAAAVAGAPAAAAAETNLTDDKELVAVITAAVAASMGTTSTDGFVVRSIKKRIW